MAFTLHVGPYDGMDAAFGAVWAWIVANGRSVAGPPRDVILVAPQHADDPAAYRTEIVWPIQ